MSYTIAKMGLWALTRTSAQALAPHVRVNAIGPGPTMQGARQSAEHFARQRAATVLGRGADPEGICAALDYLLQARAVTGQLICVDGGQHLAWQDAGRPRRRIGQAETRPSLLHCGTQGNRSVKEWLHSGEKYKRVNKKLNKNSILITCLKIGQSAEASQKQGKIPAAQDFSARLST